MKYVCKSPRKGIKHGKMFGLWPKPILWPGMSPRGRKYVIFLMTYNLKNTHNLWGSMEMLNSKCWTLNAIQHEIWGPSPFYPGMAFLGDQHSQKEQRSLPGGLQLSQVMYYISLIYYLIYAQHLKALFWDSAEIFNVWLHIKPYSKSLTLAECCSGYWYPIGSNLQVFNLTYNIVIQTIIYLS